MSILRRPAILLVVLAALAGAAAAFAYSGLATVTHPTGQHVSCQDFGYSTGGVFDSFGFNGQYSTDHSGVPQGETVTVSNYQAGQGSVVGTFSWSASVPVAQVYVQAGSTSNPQNMYTYSPNATSDAGLESPKPTISHVLFCFPDAPTAVTVRSFSASPRRDGVLLRWRTGTEARIVGFNVYRVAGAHRIRVNRALIAASAGALGAEHRWLDRTAAHRGTRYWLQTVSTSGARSWAAATAA